MNIRRRRTTRAATLADVGREAGVSAMAASAALNETRTSARISAETRVKILEAAEKLGYRPNIAARALVKRRMNTIGVAVEWWGGELNIYFIELLSGIIKAATGAGQNATLFTVNNWLTDIDRVSSVCDGRIDGMILVAPVLTAEHAAKLPTHTPFVTLHGNIAVDGVVNVESDEERGARDMVANLIALGHRRIMHLTGTRGLLGAERRIVGYRRALEEASLAPDPSLFVESRFSATDGRKSMNAWLDAHSASDLPDAIFCGNDAEALGCLEALASRGIRVPDDVSLCGFDDTIAARTTVPQLATVRQPLHDMGVRAVELLMQRIETFHSAAAEPVVSPIVFETSVVMRDSVRRRIIAD